MTLSEHQSALLKRLKAHIESSTHPLDRPPSNVEITDWIIRVIDAITSEKKGDSDE